MKRSDVLKLQECGNLHYVSDMRWILAQNRPDIEARILDGTLTTQGALRELGRVTQRERNRAKVQKVRSLCIAVLREEHERAAEIALELLGGVTATEGES